MDNIWKNAARKQHAHDLHNTTAKLALTAPVHTTDTTTLHQKPLMAGQKSERDSVLCITILLK
jgi:hypothetical protein